MLELSFTYSPEILEALQSFKHLGNMYMGKDNKSVLWYNMTPWYTQKSKEESKLTNKEGANLDDRQLLSV